MKRLFDVLVSLSLLILLTPLYALVSLVVWLDLGRPIFFCQLRPGLHGQSFKMIKFRTMINRTDSHGNLLPDSKRMTRAGKWIRSLSLDELPELINVLRGDMSLVGPRPLLMEYLPLYTAEQMRRHEVRPGITGWAQINGRNFLEWPERFKLDVWYVDNQSLWLDLSILAKTLLKVFQREGIAHAGHVTMEPFKGDKS